MHCPQWIFALRSDSLHLINASYASFLNEDNASNQIILDTLLSLEFKSSKNVLGDETYSNQTQPKNWVS